MVSVTTIIKVDDRLYDVKNEIFKEVAKQHESVSVLDDFDPYSKFNPDAKTRLLCNDQDRIDDEDDEFTYHCDFGIYNIIFKEKEFEIEYKKISEPLAICDRIDFKTELLIKTSCYDNHKDNKNLIENMMRFHAEEKIKTLKNKIKVFISDDSYWRLHTKIQKTSINNIFYKNKNKIISDIETFIKSKDIYIKEGRGFKRNYLMYGPPGTGKSSLIKAIASEFNLNLYKINLSKGLDDTSLMTAISKIPMNGLLVFEDIDSLFTNREASNNNKTFITFSSLINILDGFITKENLITIMTTNHKDKLDPAFTREGRIDMSIEFKYCDKDQINEICNHYIKDKNTKKNFINKIINIKTTSAALTKFLFENINIKKIENINDEEYIKKYKDLNEQFAKTLNMFT